MSIYRKVSLWRYDDDDNDVYDGDADYPDKKVTFPPFYYEVKFSRPVKTNGRFVFASSVLAIELEKVEEKLWGKIIITIAIAITRELICHSGELGVRRLAKEEAKLVRIEAEEKVGQ